MQNPRKWRQPVLPERPTAGVAFVALTEAALEQVGANAAGAAAGRDPDAMGRYLNLDSAPVLSVSSLDAFTDATGRAAALGFTDVVVHWPRPTGVYAGDESVLDAIAGLLTDGHVSLR